MTPVDHVAEVMLRPFQYGAADCFYAAIEVADRITGGDAVERATAIYSTRRGAAKRFLEYDDWQAAAADLSHVIGFAQIDDDPRPGDVAVIDRAFAVCIGNSPVNSRTLPLWARKTPMGTTVTSARPPVVYRYQGDATCRR